MKKSLRALMFLFIFTIVCGVIYTATVTAYAQLFFDEEANGSLLENEQSSRLLAQFNQDEKYLWGRIMIVDSSTYQDEEGNPLAYGVASNLSPASDEYEAIVVERVDYIQSHHPTKSEEPIPVDLVTVSGSGLDPSISIAAANYQLDRLATENQLSKEEVQALFDRHTTKPFLSVFGEATVNVTAINAELQKRK
ncbi:potassium-transporting ATPase subunit C [Cytobacillus kochii]|uniref:potassium-transporting ATPase subunit C n=1 Tax=Cytobacillus kochii TaxID=859143 RepID=UPI001CD61186|nr:potassium-transporting ATPase subunit C [Cytobacillus kochii]MCA1025875.1 potassium-transporting ATPase subunit C [Cytobacillus kochii]